ncbi:hypothetical protein JCM11641_007707 [Rhodosporidiobolus odoratus]
MEDPNVAPGPYSADAAPRHEVPSSRDSSVLTCAGVPLPDESRFEALSTLTRANIAARITRGELLILHPPLVYRIPHAWLRLHPGGEHALLHYVGRDASCEIAAYHSGRTVKERMGRWVIGKVDEEGEKGEGWRDMVPPIQMGMWPIPVPDIKVFSPPPSPVKSRRPSLPPTASSSSPAAASAKAVEAAESPRSLTAEMVDPPLSPVDYADLPLTPAYQAHLRRSYHKLMEQIHSLGLDSPPAPLSGYTWYLDLYLALATLAIFAYRRAETTVDWCLAAIALGLFWHQITFVAHDAAHTSITGDWWKDRLLGAAIADFIGGLSVGWWANNHNVHHLVTNAPQHDPDIQHLPFFAISKKFFSSIRSTYYDRVLTFDAFARTFVPHQHKLYYLIMVFARFNLFALSYGFLATKWPARGSPLFTMRIFELVGIAFFYTWFVGGVLRGIEQPLHRSLYIIVSCAVTSPLHVQIVLSHFSQPVSIVPPSDDVSKLPISLDAVELLESHPHRQLRTTMDITCPPYLDFLHGGLNFQVAHHFFPRLPRFRFRAVSKVIEQWVDEENKLVETREDGTRWWNGHKLGEHEGMTYKKMKFVEGNRSVLGVLKDVGDQVKVLAKVAEADAKGELHH